MPRYNLPVSEEERLSLRDVGKSIGLLPKDIYTSTEQNQYYGTTFDNAELDPSKSIINTTIPTNTLKNLNDNTYLTTTNLSPTNKINTKPLEQLTQKADNEFNLYIPENTLAYRNNNPGNLRFVGQKGAYPGEGGFARFDSIKSGYNALQDQIKLDSLRGHTLGSFLNKYAPPSENNTNQYLKFLEDKTGYSRNNLLSDLDINKIAPAIIKFESGANLLNAQKQPPMIATEPQRNQDWYKNAYRGYNYEKGEFNPLEPMYVETIYGNTEPGEQDRFLAPMLRVPYDQLTPDQKKAYDIQRQERMNEAYKRQQQREMSDYAMKRELQLLENMGQSDVQKLKNIGAETLAKSESEKGRYDSKIDPLTGELITIDTTTGRSYVGGFEMPRITFDEAAEAAANVPSDRQAEALKNMLEQFPTKEAKQTVYQRYLKLMGLTE